MNKWLILLISLYLSSFILCEEEEKNIETDLLNPNIIPLTDANYTEFMKENKEVLILFYAPWCGHCKAFAPEYSKIADTIKEQGIKVVTARVNAEENEVTSQLNNIEGFPTLKLYVNNEISEYEGDRTVDKLLSFIDKKINGSIKEVNTVKEVEELKKKNSLVLLGTGNKEEMKDFVNLSKSINDIDFIMCSSEECVKQYKSKLVFLRSFDAPIVEFPSEMELNSTSIQNFINTYSIELGGAFNLFAANAIFENKIPGLYYFRDSTNKEQADKDKVIKEVAKKFIGKMYFFVLDVKGDEIFEQAAEFFDLKEKDLPRIQITNIPSEEKTETYVMNTLTSSKDITEELLSSFVNDFFANKLQREPNSEPLPDTQDEVYTVLVGKSFKDLVINNKKTVVVLYLGRGCDDMCELVLDIWKSLAEKYKDNEDVEFATMDMTMNEVLGLDIKKFPVIMSYRKDKKDSPNKYTGDFRPITIENWMAVQAGWMKEEEKKEEKVEDL